MRNLTNKEIAMVSGADRGDAAVATAGTGLQVGPQQEDGLVHALGP